MVASLPPIDGGAGQALTRIVRQTGLYAIRIDNLCGHPVWIVFVVARDMAQLIGDGVQLTTSAASVAIMVGQRNNVSDIDTWPIDRQQLPHIVVRVAPLPYLASLQVKDTLDGKIGIVIGA